MKSLRASSAKLQIPSVARGFTLIELVVVVALISLLLSMGIIVGFDSIARSGVHEDRDLFVSLLLGQRAKALANVNESAHGLRIEDDVFVLVEVESGDEREVERSAVVEIEADSETIVFEQLSADTDQNVIVFSDGNTTQTATTSENGRIEW